jgi:SAM-dependent methyltransferase
MTFASGERDGAHACSVCGSSVSETWIAQARDYITGQEFSVRRCTVCGLARTDPEPVSMDRYYPARYRRYGAATRNVLRALYRLRVRGWLPHLPRPGRALEVGCGDGWMLGALRAHGWRVVGSERTADGARVAAEANRIPMFVGDLHALAEFRFSLVILFQVLEHLSDPMATLKAAAGLLQDGGVLVVAVPNAASWQARTFGRFWFHLDVPRHLLHFSPGALQRALHESGLRLVRTRMVSPEHDPYGVLQTLLNRIGFQQNLMTKLLMGMPERVSTWTLAVMIVTGIVLVVPSCAIALWGWMSGSGAILETWAVKV